LIFAAFCRHQDFNAKTKAQAEEMKTETSSRLEEIRKPSELLQDYITSYYRNCVISDNG